MIKTKILIFLFASIFSTGATAKLMLFGGAGRWNKYSSGNEVPVLVDQDGTFYGFFTINTYRADAVSFVKQLRKLYDNSAGDLEQVRAGVCETFSNN